MFSEYELEKINQYLSLLTCGVENNTLTTQQEKEILYLTSKCNDIIESMHIENGMIVLTPFTYKPYYDKSKPYLVYSVNCNKPETTSGYTQGYWKCPHCGEGSHFRFYNDDSYPEYYTKCPKCNMSFIVVDDSVDIDSEK